MPWAEFLFHFKQPRNLVQPAPPSFCVVCFVSDGMLAAREGERAVDLLALHPSCSSHHYLDNNDDERHTRHMVVAGGCPRGAAIRLHLAGPKETRHGHGDAQVLLRELKGGEVGLIAVYVTEPRPRKNAGTPEIGTQLIKRRG